MPRLTWYLTLLFALVATMAQGTQPLQLPPHPRLLFNREGIVQFQHKIQQEPLRSQWVRIVSELGKVVGKPIELPPRGGNWSHNYVCPVHGARLSQGRKIGPWQWEHKCPAGPHILRGNPAEATLDFDGNAIAGAHARNAELLLDLGLAWQVTGDRRYADTARALLLAYAQKYLTYPRHDNRGRPVKKDGGRVASQSLTEASWLTTMVQGADMIWDTLSPAERDTVTGRLLRPALDETILNHSVKPTIHNIQCHRDAAVGLTGLLLGDQALIDHAIDGIHGYRANMAQGVQADGVWFEGSWGYHFFTLDGVWPLTEAARNCGIDLYGPQLKKMFDAPLRLAMPNHRLPAFNDSSEVSVDSRTEIYELAYARYKDPAYATLLSKDKRTSRMALWFGEPLLPGAALPQAGTFDATASGYAVLQQGSGPQATWLCLKFGPHGGGHGHFDKNNFVLYAGGEVLMPDPGSHAYGSPLHAQWDKTSFAHNTLVVDQASQSQATGRQLCFGAESGVQYAMTDAGAIYPGVHFVRTAALLDRDLLVFVDQIRAETSHTLDVVCHLNGQWENLPAGRNLSLPRLPGYECVQDAVTHPGLGGFSLPVRTAGGQQVQLTLARGGEPTEVITGTGIGASIQQRVPLAAFRRNARETSFVWAISLGGAPELKASHANAGAATVAIRSNGRTWRLECDANRGTVVIARP